MPRIETVLPDEAQGVVKQGYDTFLTHFGSIPKPMEMLSVSPGLFEIQLKRNRYFATQSNLSFGLLTHIRYMASLELSYKFCIDFNKMLLEKQGLDDDDLRRLENDPCQSVLEEKEHAMLTFVVKALKNPGAVTDADVLTLKELGWTDKDMVDAMLQGVSMSDHAVMMQVFDMDPNCLL
ncbi:MAG: hypothetical protein MI799_03845 [Desulfobacterales bacterium]|nr:hypothetical protein [Desulfobacterales bacterium]